LRLEASSLTFLPTLHEGLTSTASARSRHRCPSGCPFTLEASLHAAGCHLLPYTHFLTATLSNQKQNTKPKRFFQTLYRPRLVLQPALPGGAI